MREEEDGNATRENENGNEARKDGEGDSGAVEDGPAVDVIPGGPPS